MNAKCCISGFSFLLGSIYLNLSQVARATQNFSPSLKIGEGGFGTVYKALLAGGQVVAKKRATKKVVDSEEFEPEAVVESKVAHQKDNSVVKMGLEEAHRGQSPC
ncbi:unnamed protein product [Camellia sinensis]